MEDRLAIGFQIGAVVRDERDRMTFDPAGRLYSNVKSYGRFLQWLMRHKSAYPEFSKPLIALPENHAVRKMFGVDAWTMGMAEIKVGETVNYWHGGNNLGILSILCSILIKVLAMYILPMRIRPMG